VVQNLISTVQFSAADVKAGVRLPKVSELLAYETGVHIGDGSMQAISGSTHSVRYWGDSVNDWQFYSQVVPRILKKLYGKEVKAHKCREANKCVVAICSKAVVTYKQALGLPAGNKLQLHGLPDFVKGRRGLLAACIRGIADTDFGLYFYKDGTPELALTLNNKPLLQDVYAQLRYLGFDPKLRLDVQRTRAGKQHTEHTLKLYGKANLEKWIQVIGFWNPKQITKYSAWKRFGMRSTGTTTEQRLALLQ
jgi:hypothetical protein